MAFFTFNQNNSGGVFDCTDTLDEYVIVEADSFESANDIMETLGGYFGGVSDGRDCGCCGDRWSSAWSDDADVEPSIYGEPISSGRYNGRRWIVHFLDGTVIKSSAI